MREFKKEFEIKEKIILGLKTKLEARKKERNLQNNFLREIEGQKNTIFKIEEIRKINI